MQKTLICTFLLIFFTGTIAFAVPSPTVIADGALLIDMNSGQVLYDKNEDKIFYPASTTKIMTALLVLENCKLDDKVIIGKNPSSFIDGNKIYLYENEEFTIDQLLHALLIESANDVAVALAEHVSGSVEAFSQLMNERAKQLGCQNTNFVNPHGLDDKNHYTTAYDLSLIAREAMENEVFRNIVNKKSYVLEPTNKQPKKRYVNTYNRLLVNPKYHIDGVNGVKTGYTDIAGHSFVGTVYRGDTKLMVVLLHDKTPAVWEDAVNLLNYGLKSYKTIEQVAEGDFITSLKIDGANVEVPLIAENNLYYTLPADQTPVIQKIIKLANDYKGSIAKGQKMGNVEYSIDGKIIGSVNLLAASDLPSTTLYSYKTELNGNLKKTYSPWLFLPVIIVLMFLAIPRLKIIIRKRSND